MIEQQKIRYAAGKWPSVEQHWPVLPAACRSLTVISQKLKTIRVMRFFLTELAIGIADYPEHFSEILDDPRTSDDEKAEVRDSVQRWDADGQFVLYWGNDYWLDRDGEVVSS